MPWMRLLFWPTSTEPVSMMDASLYWASACLHGLCNVHHLRELKYQAAEKQQTWALDLIGVLLEMKQAVQQAKEAGLTCLPAEQRCTLVVKYEAAISAGFASNHTDYPT